MHGVGARAARRLHDAVDDEVALDGGRRADGIGLVRHLHVQGLAVGLREDGDGGDAGLATGADDADGDLAAVGDEQLLELHARRPLTGRPSYRQSPMAFTAASTNDVSTMSLSGMVALMKP